jgi:hypothetical protein
MSHHRDGGMVDHFRTPGGPQMRHLLVILTNLACLSVTMRGFGQQSPFLPEDTYNKLTNEISGDIAYDNLRSLVQFHASADQSHPVLEGVEWIVGRAKSYGLEDVRMIPLPAWRTSRSSPDHDWRLLGGELWLVEPTLTKLGDVRETPFSVADNSPSADITAELIDVGEGTEDRDYTGKDVAGKIVLAYGAANRVKEMACWTRGAVAIVSFNSSRTDPWTDHPDQIAWTHLAASTEGEKPVPPAFVISSRAGLALGRQMAGRGSTHIFGNPQAVSPPRFKLHLKIVSEVLQPGRLAIAEGFVRGSSIHNQDIVLTGNIFEGLPFANDDRSGCANMLEIARALEAMIRDGRIPRPRRDIRFWWTSEISAKDEYMSEHPEERGQIIGDINQDMVGAKQSMGGLVQHISRTPFSRWSFLNDVVESIVMSLSEGNNAYLASWENHTLAPYPRPIFAHLGSREPYRVEMVPFFDDVVLNESAIGIPGVSFTNWPDEYIHSSDDDVGRIDRTQLQRNAVAVAASALYLANLSDKEFPTLAVVMSAAARERIAHDMAIGMSRLAETAGNPDAGSSEEGELKQSALADGKNLLRQAELREVAGFDTLRRFAAPEKQKLLDGVEQDIRRTTAADRQRLEECYSALGGIEAPVVLSESEKVASSRIPRRIGTLGEYLKHKQEIEGPEGLHALIKFEALNFADGKRSFLDIYDAVRAESLSAGEWYYGTVRLKDIEELFKAAETAKAMKIGLNSGVGQ